MSGRREAQSHQILIRSLAEADLAAARRLCRRIFPSMKQVSRLAFLDPYASRSKEAATKIAFIARVGNRLVGIVACQIVGATARVEAIAVAPQSRRRGIATRLWLRIQSRLKKKGVKSVWTRSDVLGYGIEILRYPEAVVFLLRMGFEKRQDIYDMEARLNEIDCDTYAAELRLRKQGITVKRIDYAERGALEQFVAKRFPHWLSVVESVRPEGEQNIHVALKGKKVIGFAASQKKWFGPMGVDPAHRVRGIGKVLLLRCLRDVRDRGHRIAIICWANFSFYAHVISAQITRAMWQMEKKLDA